MYDVAPNTHEVRRCLQKYPAERLRAADICDAEGRVAIGTGVLLFRPAAVPQLQSLACRFAEDVSVDLYGDMLPVMATETDFRQWTSKHPTLRIPLWETLSPLRFGVWSPLSLAFFHTGTTQEYLELIQHPLKAHTSILCQIPLDKGWVNLTYGVTDVPTAYEDDATLFGVPILQWLRQHKLTPDVLWASDVSQRCLWHARFYPVYHTDDPNVTFSVSIEDSIACPD